MCSIIGSFSIDKIKELVVLNQHRGNFSFSISTFDTETHELIQRCKCFGEFDFLALESCNESPTTYFICHIQAPTGGLLKELDRIHPTAISNTYLWHNGIIQPAGMEFLNQINSSVGTFDTRELHQAIVDDSLDVLSLIEGLFTCVYVKDDGVRIFRTKHGKLYVDEELNLSSERFENSKCINYNSVYKLDFSKKMLQYESEFKTLNFNFVIKGEL